MKTTYFELHGFKIERVHYKNESFLYPEFNGNFERRCTKEGFKQLSHYLRFLRHAEEMQNN